MVGETVLVIVRALSGHPSLSNFIFRPEPNRRTPPAILQFGDKPSATRSTNDFIVHLMSLNLYFDRPRISKLQRLSRYSERLQHTASIIVVRVEFKGSPVILDRVSLVAQF
jgi:hypothetical protein